MKLDALLLSATKPDPLPLRDPHLPPPPPWWPPAPGWWWLAIATLVVIAIFVAWRVRERRRRLAHARFFDANVDAASAIPSRIAKISELLRRAARRSAPGADTLAGEDWLRFLDGERRDSAFATGVGRMLLDSGFRPEHDAANEQAFLALRALARERFVELMHARGPRSRRWRVWRRA